jgi:hypothetical protein
MLPFGSSTFFYFVPHNRVHIRLIGSVSWQFDLNGVPASGHFHGTSKITRWTRELTVQEIGGAFGLHGKFWFCIFLAGRDSPRFVHDHA